MSKYRKKPVVIEAIKVTADNEEEVYEFMGLMAWKSRISDDGIIIETLEGTMTASINDYIVKGVQGEFYPCKPDIFHETYEEVK